MHLPRLIHLMARDMVLRDSLYLPHLSTHSDLPCVHSSVDPKSGRVRIEQPVQKRGLILMVYILPIHNVAAQGTGIIEITQKMEQVLTYYHYGATWRTIHQ